jgi:hypothetical protein
MHRAPLLALAASCLAFACAKADRIEIRPGTVSFLGAGKQTALHATPYEKNGRHIPDPPCTWTSSDEKVARVAGQGNDATLTAVGTGSAVVRCTIGSAAAELMVQVRVVARLLVRTERADLSVTDAPTPLLLSVEAFDDRGASLGSRTAVVTCEKEEVCRGDARGQVWPVGPGETTAHVELEGAAATLPVKVVEKRSADARPKAVKGNYAEDLVKEWEKKQQREAATSRKRSAPPPPRAAPPDRP